MADAYKEFYEQSRKDAEPIQLVIEQYWQTVQERVRAAGIQHNTFDYTIAMALAQKAFDWVVNLGSLGGNLQGLSRTLPKAEDDG